MATVGCEGVFHGQTYVAQERNGVQIMGETTRMMSSE
jgi:hypothetical protein